MSTGSIASFGLAGSLSADKITPGFGSNRSKTSANVSLGGPNTEKQMKVFRCLEPLMKHKARIFVCAKLTLSWQQNFVGLLKIFVVQKRSRTTTTPQSCVTAALTDSRKQTTCCLNTLTNIIKLMLCSTLNYCKERRFKKLLMFL